MLEIRRFVESFVTLTEAMSTVKAHDCSKSQDENKKHHGHNVILGVTFAPVF
jgi:hypothetical protein